MKTKEPLLGDTTELIKSLNKLAAIAHNDLLKTTSNGKFFTEQEYKDNLGKLIISEGLRFSIEKSIQRDEPIPKTMTLKELQEFIQSK